jgi:hypothetical protein
MSSPSTSTPPGSLCFDWQWMLRLRDQAEEWLRREGRVDGPTPMTAYTDLVFAFGLARLGELDEARRLEQRARVALDGRDEIHEFLLDAYGYRIKQGLEGKPHGGPLPDDQIGSLVKMDRMPRYVVDRLRQHSKILEPNERLDPYRYWGGRISELDRALAELVDLSDKQEIARRVRTLLHEIRGTRANEDRARTLRAALDLAPRVGEEFARDMLDRVLVAYDALPEPTDQPSLMDRALFLEKALGVAVHFNRHEDIAALVERFQKMLQSQKGERGLQALEWLIGRIFRAFRKFGLRDEIDQLLMPVTEAVLGGRDLASLEWGQAEPALLRALLQIALGWEFLGLGEVVTPLLAGVRQVLFKEDLSCKEKTSLVYVYAGTVGQFRPAFARPLLEEVFQKLTGIRDAYTTNTYYSLAQLDVIEGVVLAICDNPAVAHHP